MTPETWEKEYDNLIIQLNDMDFPSQDGHAVRVLKSFIASEIYKARYEAEQKERKIWFGAEKQERQRILQVIESMKYNQDCEGVYCKMTWNEAIEAIKEKLT